ncbi:hypothetical protein Sp245p_03420 [Azospirillum baldaniorum]|uniref:hypothetical protein n=1 Tax=Azospirillum baldaniorum TaxID=1064539 RepID=UPI00059FF7A8|nr:hypothetical protein [Azospirillum baldaniorum]AWJ88904.1 hypothetical protein Sp245p_03420 [Azospirillum baldaniorum]
MATDAEDQARRVAGLRSFFEANKDGLENPNVWSKASGVSYNSLNEPLSGAKTPNISIKTLERLADGATKLLKRPVTIDQLIGREAPVPELDEMADAIFGAMSPKQKAEAIKKLTDDLASSQ